MNRLFLFAACLFCLAIIPLLSVAQITVTSPNGGEVWDGGSWKYVTWNVVGLISQTKVELSTNGGISWDSVGWSPAGPSRCGLVAPDIFSDQCLVRVGDMNYPSNVDVSDSAFSIRPSSFGHPWIEKASGTSADLHDVTFVDSLDGWVCGASGTILRTIDGGETWEPVASGTTSSLSTIGFSPGGIGIAVGGGGTVLRSNDRGLTWEATPSGSEGDLGDFAFHGETGIAAVGFRSILRSTDAGISWANHWDGGVEGTGDLHAVAFMDSLHGVIVGGSGPYGTGSVSLMTSDAGATWDLWPLPFEPMGWDLVECLGQSLIVMSGNYLYPFGSVSMLTRTNDGGEQWEDLAYYNTINNGYAIYFTSIMLADSGSLYVSGTDSFGKGVFLGFGNGGDSLSPGSSYYFEEGTSGVWFSTPMKGTIVGRGGSLPDFQRGTCECGAGGCEVHTGRFPPPAKLPESVQPVHNDPLCITAWIVRDARSLQHARAAGGYTLQGEQEAGYHEAVFDASGLASGVYLYRLQAGSYVETRKLVLVR